MGSEEMRTAESGETAQSWDTRPKAYWSKTGQTMSANKGRQNGTALSRFIPGVKILSDLRFKETAKITNRKQHLSLKNEAITTCWNLLTSNNRFKSLEGREVNLQWVMMQNLTAYVSK